jgi:hypothetical protein
MPAKGQSRLSSSAMAANLFDYLVGDGACDAGVPEPKIPMVRGLSTCCDARDGSVAGVIGGDFGSNVSAA